MNRRFWEDLATLVHQGITPINFCLPLSLFAALNRGTLGIDQAACALTEDIIDKLLLKSRLPAHAPDQDHDQQKKKSLKPNLVQDVEMKLLDSLACVVLSTKNARQSWAMEMLVKSLRQIIIEQPQTNHPMFEAISHADMKNILPEMAQLQWTLPDCSTPVFKMETNGKIF